MGGTSWLWISLRAAQFLETASNLLSRMHFIYKPTIQGILCNPLTYILPLGFTPGQYSPAPMTPRTGPNQPLETVLCWEPNEIIQSSQLKAWLLYLTLPKEIMVKSRARVFLMPLLIPDWPGASLTFPHHLKRGVAWPLLLGNSEDQIIFSVAAIISSVGLGTSE